MNWQKTAWVLALCGVAPAGCETSRSIGVIRQDDAHVPLPWRSLTPTEQEAFQFGYAIFNTGWAPANQPAGRTDGLGPLFNAQSCDACHNSRRRGRGPRSGGEAPVDLVIQLGRLSPDGTIQRGIDEYGHVLNTAAAKDFHREAAVSIQYEEQARGFPDGTQVSLRRPRYQVSELSGGALPATTILMPRMPPSVQGVGLLELVPQSELTALAKSVRHSNKAVSGRVSWLKTDSGEVVGRFGWQATEPSVASQTASAFSREMGLTTPMVEHIDCGKADDTCRAAATGGVPEVEAALFDALVLFERLHAVPIEKPRADFQKGEKLFVELGCADCHRVSLQIATGGAAQLIHPYTDLLLHDMGPDLADCDLAGNTVKSEWRTAPLWGMQAAVASTQPLRLLHDGRARTIEEAVMWHDGEGRESRERFMRLDIGERRALAAWIEQL